MNSYVDKNGLEYAIDKIVKIIDDSSNTDFVLSDSDKQDIADLVQVDPYESMAIEIELKFDSWADKMQTIVVPELEFRHNGYVSLSNNMSEEAYGTAILAYITVVAQDNQTITFYYSGDEPTVDIVLQLILL